MTKFVCEIYRNDSWTKSFQRLVSRRQRNIHWAKKKKEKRYEAPFIHHRNLKNVSTPVPVPLFRAREPPLKWNEPRAFRFVPPSSRRKSAFQRGGKCTGNRERWTREGQQSNSPAGTGRVHISSGRRFSIGDDLRETGGWNGERRKRPAKSEWEEKGEKERDPDFIFVDELGIGPTRLNIYSLSLPLCLSLRSLVSIFLPSFSFSFSSALPPRREQELEGMDDGANLPATRAISLLTTETMKQTRMKNYPISWKGYGPLVKGQGSVKALEDRFVKIWRCRFSPFRVYTWVQRFLFFNQGESQIFSQIFSKFFENQTQRYEASPLILIFPLGYHFRQGTSTMLGVVYYRLQNNDTFLIQIEYRSRDNSYKVILRIMERWYRLIIIDLINYMSRHKRQHRTNWFSYFRSIISTCWLCYYYRYYERNTFNIRCLHSIFARVKTCYAPSTSFAQSILKFFELPNHAMKRTTRSEKSSLVDQRHHELQKKKKRNLNDNREK